MAEKEAKKILIVDDEKDTVEMITALLKLEGFQVLPALSGDEAMRILAVESQKVPESETPVDLILLDAADGGLVLADLVHQAPDELLHLRIRNDDVRVVLVRRFRKRCEGARFEFRVL